MGHKIKKIPVEETHMEGVYSVELGSYRFAAIVELDRYYEGTAAAYYYVSFSAVVPYRKKRKLGKRPTAIREVEVGVRTDSPESAAAEKEAIDSAIAMIVLRVE